MLSVIMLRCRLFIFCYTKSHTECCYDECLYAECHYANCRISIIVMLMLNGILLSMLPAVILSAVMLTGVAPFSKNINTFLNSSQSIRPDR
jgi:hypothetical protein